MGDNIEENYWEGEEEVNLADYGELSADEYDSDGSEGVANDIAEGQEKAATKVEKRKAKFAEMKEKKRKVLAAAAAAAADIDESEEATSPGLLSSKNKAKTSSKGGADLAPSGSLTQPSVYDMLEMLYASAPREYPLKDSTDEGVALKFEAADFFYPEFEEDEKMQAPKQVCPFVRALSVSLPSYRKMILNINNYTASDFGCPILLIVCASALRSTEIVKELSSKIPKCKIAKLFAKHIKTEEQMDLLSKSYYPIAIGTPNRISKLIEMGALSLRKVKIFLTDVTRDVKQTNILTMAGVKDDFFKLLSEDVAPEKAHMKIALVRGANIGK